MEAFLYDSATEALASFQTRNAVFLAERLTASFPTEENWLLLATCYLRSKQTHRAYAVLKGCDAPACRYLFAVAGLELSKLEEVERAMLPDLLPDAADRDEPRSSLEVPGGASGCALLGTFYLRTNRRSLAVAYFSEALSANPFCWSAFEELCAMGYDAQAQSILDAADVSSLYPTAAAMAEGADAGGPRRMSAEGTEFPHLLSTPAPVAGGHSLLSPARGLRTGAPSRVSAAADTDTHMAGGVSLSTPGTASFVTPAPPSISGAHGGPAAAAKAGGRGMLASFASAGGAGGTTAPGSLRSAPRRKFVDEGKLRKVSGRLFTDVPAQSLRRSSRLASGGLATPMPEAPPAPQAAAPRREREGGEVQWALSGGGGLTAEGGAETITMLRTLGNGLRLLASYRCREAISAFALLPAAQYRSAYVLSCVGRAHAECADYISAERVYSTLRQLSPHHLEGLEHYSTVLWHLKRDSALAYLAQEAIALDRQHPTTWSIVGNCLSLQREHESALRAFGRAVALDVEAPYAYTLIGHEHFTGEDLVEAKRNFRIAAQLDPRHYNALYGMGAVLMREEKYNEAEYHFQRALEINPRSSVLHCCMAQALYAQQKFKEALACTENAILTDGRNPLARYERAVVLARLDRCQEALTELSALKDLAPREATVYTLMARVYKRTGQPGLAALCAGTGADLGGAKETNSEADETVLPEAPQEAAPDAHPGAP